MSKMEIAYEITDRSCNSNSAVTDAVFFILKTLNNVVNKDRNQDFTPETDALYSNVCHMTGNMRCNTSKITKLKT